ncbi:hypothetical protein LCGC14_0422560 [marine sediment metagenome]|uniref:Uncharacterized protein n=1 Tax=marine sediment metagenome TaxID=412755 RepID=A0A0F9VZH7_9ZZZZ
MSSDVFISDGLTRERISPATANLQRELRDLLQTIQEGSAGAYSILAGPDQVIITTTSAKLNTLGIVFKDDLRRLTIIPEGTNIYWSLGGTAKSGINLLPLASLELDIVKSLAEKLEFVMSTSTENLTIVQEG